MTLLKWAALCLVIALVAAVFGFGGIAEGATDIARVLVVIAIVIAAILGILGMAAYRKVT